MPAILIALTVLLFATAALSAHRAKSLLKKYQRDVPKLPIKSADQLASSEKKWRYSAHIFSLLCLAPLAALLTYRILYLTVLIQRVVGAAIAAALIMAVLSKLLDLKWAAVNKLFAKDVAMPNEIVLALVGFLVSLLITSALVVWRQHALRDELLKHLK